MSNGKSKSCFGILLAGGAARGNHGNMEVPRRAWDDVAAGNAVFVLNSLLTALDLELKGGGRVDAISKAEEEMEEEEVVVEVDSEERLFGEGYSCVAEEIWLLSLLLFGKYFLGRPTPRFMGVCIDAG